MIENLRKYTGLIIVVFVILFVSFFFLDTRSMRNSSGGQPMMKIAGRTYTDKEFRSLGDGSLELASMLAGSGDFSLYQFIMGLSSGAASREESTKQFFIGRMIIRNAKEEFGVFPSEQEVTDYLRGLRAFSGPDGNFSLETYHKFTKNYLGRFGMTERNLRELASDVLATKKITEIIGAGLTVDRAAVAANLALDNQQISGEVAKMDLAAYEDKIKPTDEEIKTYWEGISDSFTTEPRRKFTYVLISPKATEEAKVEEPAETIADVAASDEAKKAAAKKKEEEQAKRAADLAETRRKNQLETDSLVDDFVNDLVEQKGAGFEELAKQNGWEVQTTELFTKAAPPEGLNLTLRSASTAGKAADELFKVTETSDPFSKISEAIPVGENQWLIARLDGEEKSRPKEFAEASAEARAQYISEKGVEALKAAAEEAVSKIKPLLASGKTFAEAAKEAGISEVKEFTDVTKTHRPDPFSEPANLFEAARSVDPGAIADVITESDRVFILHVVKREVVKAADQDARIESEVQNRTTENEMVAFISWMAERTEAAKVQPLN